MANEPSASVSAQVSPEPVHEWVARMRRGGVQSLVSEFNKIKAEPLTGTTKAYDANPGLNRYGNIPLLDSTRVIINDGLGDIIKHDYIHASYVDGYNTPKAYVISQAPVPDAVIDYWRMVWAERIPLIVCLTSLKERGSPKAEPFFPPSIERAYRAGPFRIMITAVYPLAGHPRVVVLHLKLQCWIAHVNKTGNARQRVVIMIYYGNWPDTAVPQETPLFLKFVRLVRQFEAWTVDKYVAAGFRPPVLVHCSAGVGRSATLVACRIALDQLEHANQVDIVGQVRKMRRQRAMAVQNHLQYVFIHLLIAEAAKQRRQGK